MEVDINEYTYRIIEVPEFDKVLENDNGIDYHFGMCDYKKATIYLAKEQPIDRKYKTLIHELTHAFLEAYGFYSHKDNFNEEDICEFVSIYSGNIIQITNKYFKEVAKCTQ